MKNLSIFELQIEKHYAIKNMYFMLKSKKNELQPSANN